MQGLMGLSRLGQRLKQNTKAAGRISLIATFAWLSGCATTYDPAEVCTAEWIKPRADRALAELKNDTQDVFKALRRNADSWASGQVPGAFQMIALSSALKKLQRQVEYGQGVKDLKVLANTCDDPDIVLDSISSFMRDQGLPEQMVTFIEDLPAYQEALEEIIKDIDKPAGS